MHRVSFKMVVLGLALVVAGCASQGVTGEAESVGEASTGTRGLAGSAWRLEDLGGAELVEGSSATLEFPEEGRVAGNASCNRFFGSVEISGDALRFGAMGSTRMACAEAVNRQESAYLKALEGAERFQRDGSTLFIYSKGMAKPLRFVRKEA